MVTYDQLVKLDSRYFKEAYRKDNPKVLTEEQAAYRLATWLFDNEERQTTCRKKLKQQIPQAYVMTLEKLLDEDHDT